MDKKAGVSKEGQSAPKKGLNFQKGLNFKFQAKSSAELIKSFYQQSQKPNLKPKEELSRLSTSINRSKNNGKEKCLQPECTKPVQVHNKMQHKGSQCSTNKLNDKP